MVNNSGWSALTTTAIILRSRSAAVSSAATRGSELLEPLLVVAELAAVGEVLTEVLIRQPEFVEQDRGPVGPEAAAVEADVEQPVVLVVRLFGGRVEQVPGRRVLTLDADLGLQGTAPDRAGRPGHVLQLAGTEVVQELPVGVVPEDDPVPLLVEEPGECGVDLGGIHQSSSPPVQLTRSRPALCQSRWSQVNAGQ